MIRIYTMKRCVCINILLLDEYVCVKCIYIDNLYCRLHTQQRTRHSASLTIKRNNFTGATGYVGRAVL
jgi:hypothetical protein